MHTDTETNSYREDPPWYDDDSPRPTSWSLETALIDAQTRADELAADTNEKLIARAYGRIYTRLKELHDEAVMIDRIARGA